jgi:hypothetical protein
MQILRESTKRGKPTLETGDFVTSGSIPIEVLLASIMPVSGRKSDSFSSSIASAPTDSASAFARSEMPRKTALVQAHGRNFKGKLEA